MTAVFSAKMKLPVVQLTSTTEKAFVTYWSAWYRYGSEGDYTDNIGNAIEPDSLRRLFEWKNGGKLSRSKDASVERHFVGKCDYLRSLPKSTTAADFLSRFGGGPIWRIFLLHCWNPTSFPIYDQHVHRAMEYMQNGTIAEVPSGTKAVIEAYTTRYLPFWDQFGAHPNREADKALWSFGKFLKQFPRASLQNISERE